VTEPDRPRLAENHWALVNRLLVEIQAGTPAARPNYTWSVLHVAAIAARRGAPQISVLEFGVAGGAGLLALEAAARTAEARLGVGIDVYGFDTGSGLPAPRDLRDAPFCAAAGHFPMDEAKLRSRLTRAELVLGDVADTVTAFLTSAPSPIGFVAFDLDYYSSTRDALTLFAGGCDCLMPRVMCYFDDTHGYPWGDCNGARYAIHEFNRIQAQRNIAQLHGLRYLLPLSESGVRWPEAIYVAHFFDHPEYSEPEGTELVTRLDLPS
jgi:hypothetical protein